MRIAFEKLAAQMIEAVVDEAKGRTVRLGPTGPFRGHFEKEGGRSRIEGHLEVATLFDVAWTFDNGTHLRLVGPVTFRSLQGRIDIGPQGVRVEVEAERVELPELQVATKNWTLRFEDIVLTDAELSTGGGEPTSIRATDARAEEARYDAAAIDMSVAALHLEGVAFGVGFFRADGLSGRTVRVDAHVPPVRGGRGEGISREQVEALDRLDGSFSVVVDTGLVIDAGWPVVGRRKAEHHFELPIRGGRLPAPKVEDGLSTLEDAVLDLVFDDQGLALEAGFPSVASKTVLRWPLSDAEREAAARDQSMLLSRWITPAIPLRDEGGDDGWLKLDHLALRSGHGAFSYGGHGTWHVGQGHLRLGTEHGPPFEQLAIGLEIQLQPSGEGRLGFTAEKVHLGARDIPIGAIAIDLERLDIVSLDEGEVRFQGWAPQLVGATGRVVSLRKLALRWP